MELSQQNRSPDLSSTTSSDGNLEHSISRTSMSESAVAAPVGNFFGKIVGFGNDSRPKVFVENSPRGSYIADSIVALNSSHVDARVLVTFTDDGKNVPVILGLLQPDAIRENNSKAANHETTKAEDNSVSVEADGQRLVLSAEKEIVLQCGKASITLTKAGKVLIRGAYVLNRSSGVNRIKGGVVHIN